MRQEMEDVVEREKQTALLHLLEELEKRKVRLMTAVSKAVETECNKVRDCLKESSNHMAFVTQEFFDDLAIEAKALELVQKLFHVEKRSTKLPLFCQMKKRKLEPDVVEMNLSESETSNVFLATTDLYGLSFTTTTTDDLKVPTPKRSLSCSTFCVRFPEEVKTSKMDGSFFGIPLCLKPNYSNATFQYKVKTASSLYPMMMTNVFVRSKTYYVAVACSNQIFVYREGEVYRTYSLALEKGCTIIPFLDSCVRTPYFRGLVEWVSYEDHKTQRFIDSVVFPESLHCGLLIGSTWCSTGLQRQYWSIDTQTKEKQDVFSRLLFEEKWCDCVCSWKGFYVGIIWKQLLNPVFVVSQKGGKSVNPELWGGKRDWEAVFQFFEQDIWECFLQAENLAIVVAYGAIWYVDLQDDTRNVWRTTQSKKAVSSARHKFQLLENGEVAWIQTKSETGEIEVSSWSPHALLQHFRSAV